MYDMQMKPLNHHHTHAHKVENLPGYVLPIRSTKALSNPAMMEPPTGTIKFLSVLCTKASTLPTLAA
jgi:hypothetical protein